MIEPFADDDGASSIGGLSIENGTARVLLSGSVEIARDQSGLARARELKHLVDGLVRTLEKDPSLGAGDPPEIASVDRVVNPFA